MTFLPDNYKYEKPKGGGRYFRLTEGDNIFRVLSPAITGWEDWTLERQPVRTKDKPQFPIIEGKYPKQFWSFVVFDYSEEDKEKAIKILNITQASIQEALYGFHTSKEWGDPKNYDINIKRTGKELDTKYTVMPSPPSVLGADIVTLYSNVKVDLNKLFINGDPFKEDEVPEGHPSHPQAVANPSTATSEDDITPEQIANIPF